MALPEPSINHFLVKTLTKSKLECNLESRIWYANHENVSRMTLCFKALQIAHCVKRIYNYIII